MKKRICLALTASILCFFKGTAQEVSPTIPQEDLNQVYWVDSTTNYERVLNPNRFTDNCFITVNAGTFFSLGDNGGSAKTGKMFQPAAGFSLGSWLSPWGGIRVMGMYGQGAGHTYKPVMDEYYNWKIVTGYVDGLFNLHNLFGRYKENRVFQIMALIGVGVEHNWGFSNEPWYAKAGIDTGKKTLLGLRTGALASLRLGKAVSLNVEATIHYLDDSYDGAVHDNKNDYRLNLLAGLVYRFKNHDGTHQFTFTRRNQEKFTVLNEEINRLRLEAERLKSIPNVKVEKEIVKSNQVTTLISFDPKSTTVNKLQEVNVYTAAQAIKKIEDGDLYITPYDKTEDKDLFNGRANAIREILINQYNIPAGHIFIEANNEIIKSLDPSANCVIVYIIK